ncbi:hypothetical protein D3C75_839600 [compost metagenome]
MTLCCVLVYCPVIIPENVSPVSLKKFEFTWKIPSISKVAPTAKISFGLVILLGYFTKYWPAGILTKISLSDIKALNAAVQSQRCNGSVLLGTKFSKSSKDFI